MPGKPKDKLKYLKSIDEFDFPYLIADILSSHFNHYNVRVVDGTGDGKRDVFSINRKGEKVVTQCKYHYDMGKTSGTRETDEIAIALNKFKCNIGFFCTSGKLSPQSKREYLDNYPDFELNWLEGHEIVDIVLEDSILRKIWFENEKIHLTKSCVSIPFIFRKLPDDSSLEPVISYDFRLPNEIKVVVKEKSLFSPSQFRPFNDLDIRKSGGSFGNTFAFEIKLAGKINYNSIDDIKTQIVEQVSKESTLQFPDSYVAIRFGIPHLSEDNDSFRKYKVEKSNFPINSETYLLKDGQIQEEYDFLIETGDDWKRPYRISMSQLSDFRFYNKNLDLVFNMYYSCAAKEELHPHVTRNIEIEKILWKKSIFVSGERNIIEKFTELPADKIFLYGPNGILAGWIHPRPIMYPADINQFEQELIHEEFEKEKEKIKEIISAHNMELVEWEKASKIAAINDEDPFPSNPETSYRIVDIFENFHTLPSPINPDKREFIFECVWAISNHSHSSFEEINEEFSKFEKIKALTSENKLNFTIDDETHEIIYLRVTYKPTFTSYLSTIENLNILQADVTNVFDGIEKYLSKIFPETMRATKNYWFSELGIFLDGIN